MFECVVVPNPEEFEPQSELRVSPTGGVSRLKPEGTHFSLVNLFLGDFYFSAKAFSTHFDPSFSESFITPHIGDE